MVSPLNIYPPKNWQDFEKLCLKLWGEIWEIPHEIEFNSDNAQGQQGVDIYGPINEGQQYFGIQCKNKKLNLIDGEKNRITISDLQIEIEKAKSFKPQLKKLIIATSLPKDQKLEEYIRIESQKNVLDGLFYIQICFWDFFERKIPEFKKVYDWYLNNEEFYKKHSIEILFKGKETVKKFFPKFQRNINHYILKQPEFEDQLKNEIHNLLINNQPASEYLKIIQSTASPLNLYNQTVDWNQLCWFKLYVKNTGEAVIEDYKIELEFEGNFIEVGAEKPSVFERQYFKTDIKEYSNSKRDLYIKPYEKTLVQSDSFITDYIYIKPVVGGYEKVNLNWKLLSRDFNCNGTLTIEIDPQYYTVDNNYFVDNQSEVAITENISLIKRRGIHGINGIQYLDKETDYKFE